MTSPSYSPYGTGPMNAWNWATGRASTSTASQEAWYEALAEEQRRQYDDDFKLKKTELDRRYQLDRLSARTAEERNEIDREYNRAQIQLAQQRLAQEQQQFGMTLQQRESEFARQFGLNQAQLEEQKRQFDATGQLNYAQLAENRRQFDAGQGQQNEQFYATLAQRDREFGAANYLDQARLGYDVASQQAQFEQNPADYWIAADNARGVAAQEGTATFLNALQNGGVLRAYGAQAGIPQVASWDGMVKRLYGDQQPAAVDGSVAGAPAMPAEGTMYAGGSPTYDESTGQWKAMPAPAGGGDARPMPTSRPEGGGMSTGYAVRDADGPVHYGGPQQEPRPATVPSRGVAPYSTRDQQNLAAGRAIYQRGAHKIGPGQLESLSGTELALLEGTIKKAGGDWATFLDQHRRSRFGNRTSMARAA